MTLCIGTHKSTVMAKLKSCRSRKRLMFGIWCVYNNFGDEEVIEFVEKQTNNTSCFSAMRQFLETAWAECILGQPMTQKTLALELSAQLQAMNWEHEDIEVQKDWDTSWLGICALGLHDAFLNYVLYGKLKDLAYCSESVINIIDYKEQFEMDNTRNSSEEESAIHIEFLSTGLKNITKCNNINFHYKNIE